MSHTLPLLELSISRQPHFLIQQSTADGLSYKVKKAVNSAHLQAPVPPWETHQKNVSCVLVF